MENPVGKTLGPYQITERLGQSATGVLYKAYHPWLKHHVTIRALPSHLARDHTFLQRIRAAARLAHRNIAAIYDLRQDHDTTYLVTEYIQGTSLDQIIQPGKRLNPRAIVPILRALALALDCAHSQGIVHGGLKPGNILLTRDGRPVVTDFGLAARQGSASDAELEALKYMAPEQAQGGLADSHTDMYSLGAVLYYMLTGQAPFEGTNAQAVRAGLTRQSPVPPSQLNTAVRPEVDAVVLKALHKNPEQRYQQAKDLAEAFRAAVDREEPEPEGPGLLQWVAVAASLVTILIVIGTAVLRLRAEQGPPNQIATPDSATPAHLLTIPPDVRATATAVSATISALQKTISAAFSATETAVMQTASAAATSAHTPTAARTLTAPGPDPTPMR